ncbi:EipA family protein [Enterococcus faecalis]
MILAPIRSGLGLRIGANIGYIRFTPKQTWNPF